MRNIYFLFLAAVLAAALLPQDASAWCNSSYVYRVPLNINTTTNLTNYQIPFNLTYDAVMNANFSDLLYCDKNDVVRPFWIESQVNSSWAYVWANASVNNTNGTQGYIYFGNPTAASASDDWNTMVITPRISTLTKQTAARTGRNDSAYSLNVQALSNNYANVYTNISAGTNLMITGRMNTTYTTAASWAGGLCFYWNITDWACVGTEQDTQGYNYLANNVQTITNTGTAASANIYYWYRIILNTTNIEFFRSTDGVTYTSTNLTTNKWGGTAPKSVIIGKGYSSGTTYTVPYFANDLGSGGTMNTTYDNVIVRKYITPEPTLSSGAKENNRNVVITSPSSDGLWYTYSLLPTITANCTTDSFANMTGSGAFIATKTSNPATWTNTSALTDGLNSVTITCSDSDGTNVTATRTFNYAASPTGVSSGAAAFNLTFTGNENNVFWLNLSKTKGVVNATLNVSGYENSGYNFDKNIIKNGNFSNSPPTNWTNFTINAGVSPKETGYGGNKVWTTLIRQGGVDSINGDEALWNQTINLTTGQNYTLRFSSYVIYSGFDGGYPGYFNYRAYVKINGTTIWYSYGNTSGISETYTYNYTAVSNSTELRLGVSFSGTPCLNCLTINSTFYNISLSRSNITNPYLDTANSGSPWEWNYTDEFNSTVGSKAVNLNATLINSYLSSCTADAGGYCQVPIIAHSDTAGILQISNININDSSFLQVVNTTGQAISTFTANFSNGTYTKVYFTTTGLVVASLSELPSGATNLTITQDGYRKNDTITYTIDKTTANPTYFNTTSTLTAASVLINAYDEKSPSTAINFTVTFANSTLSKTWANQSAFSQKWDNLTLGYSTITISSTGYATRNYYLTITPQTYEQINSYLMQTSQGQTTRFHYVTITNQAIQSVLTTAQKSINGVLTTVEQETSDSSGSSTLFLDPTVTYTITSTNAAYNTQVSSIQPSLQDYTIYLTSLSNTINISYQYGDVSIALYPTQTILERHSPGLQYFNITVNSTSGALTNWGWNLTFNGTSIYSNQLTNAYGGKDQYLWDYTFVNTTTPLYIDTWFTKDGTTTHHYDMFSVGNISTGGNTLYDIFSTIKSGSTKNITALNGSTVTVTTAPQYGFMSVALIIICLIINALVMSYVNQYTMTGAGMFGVMLLALEWSAGLMPGAIVTFAAIIVIAILVLRGYF